MFRDRKSKPVFISHLLMGQATRYLCSHLCKEYAGVFSPARPLSSAVGIEQGRVRQGHPGEKFILRCWEALLPSSSWPTAHHLDPLSPTKASTQGSGSGKARLTENVTEAHTGA